MVRICQALCCLPSITSLNLHRSPGKQVLSSWFYKWRNKAWVNLRNFLCPIANYWWSQHSNKPRPNSKFHTWGYTTVYWELGHVEAMELPCSSLPSRQPAAGSLANRQLLDLWIHRGFPLRPRFPGASLHPSELDQNWPIPTRPGIPLKLHHLIQLLPAARDNWAPQMWAVWLRR